MGHTRISPAKLGSFCLIFISVSACDSGSSSAPPPASEGSDLELGLDERPSNSNCIAPDSPGQLPDEVQLVDAFPKLLGLNRPVAMIQVPGDASQFFVAEREGRILRFQNSEAANSTETVFDIGSRLHDLEVEGGLLGMAFHPEAAQNRKIYLSYTTADSGPPRSVVSRLTFAEDFSSIQSDSERVLLELEQPAGNHNGGHLAFGPDGYLYIGFGDGGSDSEQSQDATNFHGALLRVEVDPDTENEPFYQVPEDNPFADDPDRDKVYAYGLRNPWRWSFDQSSGQLWLADVGQAAYEEINHIEAGGNYGWPIMEGSGCQRGECDTTGLETPIFNYGHSNGRCSITGGYVYRGRRMPGLTGTYIYGDFCTGEVWGLSEQENGYQSTLLAQSLDNLSSFAQDAAGEIYALPFSGSARILQLRPGDFNTGDNSHIPARLSESDCFSSADPAQPSDALIPFDVLVPLWSDGADKQRFMALPDGEQVIVDDDGDFHFPVGTILAKHFSHNNTMIETRLFMRHQDRWAGYSYEWNAAQNDAVLLDDAKDAQVAGLDWHFPSRSECMQCHNEVKNFALAPELRQLNHDFEYPSTGRRANQVDTLAGINLLAAMDAEMVDETFFALDDQSASLQQRAKSYLDVNCAQCHQPNGGTNSGMDLRFATAFADMNICNVEGNENMGLDNPRLLVPADPSRSLLLQRMQAEDEHRMPPLATNVVDEEAVAVIHDWISGVGNCP